MDELTHISTFEDISQYLEASQKEARPLFAVVFDFDGLAWLNSYRGYPGGDDALIRIATRLNEIAEAQAGKVFRSGDDEFLLLCDCDAKRALSIADEGMAAIKDLKIPYKRLGDPNGTATASAIVFASPSRLGDDSGTLSVFIEERFKSEKARGCSKRNLLLDLSGEELSWE